MVVGNAHLYTELLDYAPNHEHTIHGLFKIRLKLH